MKPQLLRVPTAPAYSFNVRQDLVPNLNNRWHYHPEIELIHFHRGAGTQFVGDSIKRFASGDIVLVGANVPHYWRDDDGDILHHKMPKPYSTVVHFTENFWGDRFLELAENKPLKLILDKSRRGLMLTGEAKDQVAGLLAKMCLAEGVERIILLMQSLLAIAKSEDLFRSHQLASSLTCPNQKMIGLMPSMITRFLISNRKSILKKSLLWQVWYPIRFAGILRREPVKPILSS